MQQTSHGNGNQFRRQESAESADYTYSFLTKVKGLKNKVKVVITIGKWHKDDPKDVHIFVSNHLAYSPEQILQKYALRWGIEWIFRDLKENVAFDHYQTRTIQAITRHWHLATLAYTFLLWCKLNGLEIRHGKCSPLL